LAAPRAAPGVSNTWMISRPFALSCRTERSERGDNPG
jgi:hypothetical protein